MKRSLHVAVLPGHALGFRLAGVPVDELTPGEAPERLRALLGEGGPGVVAMEEPLFRRIPEDVRARLAREGIPLVVPFELPSRREARAREESYAAAMIREAIGYHIKIRGEP